MFKLHVGDVLDILPTLADNSVDSIVTDPPYELGFMGKIWDASGIAYNVDMWREALRVLKPGGHLLAFSGSRTYHRMTCAIEDAGFEVRDQIMWVYGSGFPKSQNVSIAIDKQAGARGHASTRFNAVGQQGERTTGGDVLRSDHPDYVKPQPITDSARQWEGWGTALKPAHEPICVARKPLVGTVAANVLQFGTGALNIDGCRVHSDDAQGGEYTVKRFAPGASVNKDGNWKQDVEFTGTMKPGRWPANLIHDGSDEVRAAFPDANGQQGDLVNHGKCRQSPNGIFGGMRPALDHPARQELDKNASRFFYCAKASKKDRGEGNTHPTVKPTDLMAYLVRLVTPPSGTVLDPFMGSGSTGKAAMREGLRFVGVDMTPEYVDIATARIEHELNQIAKDLAG